MTYEPLNRRLSILVAVFTFLGVALGVIALATNYWSVRTVIREVNNGTINVQQPVEEWNGLFNTCQTGVPCFTNFFAVTFVLSLLGLVLLLIGGVFSVFDFPRPSNCRFITPLLIFVACVLLTAGLFDYAASALLNYHSSRAFIAALVFAYSALPIAAFVAGRFSALERSVLINNEVHTAQKYSATNGNGL